MGDGNIRPQHKRQPLSPPAWVRVGMFLAVVFALILWLWGMVKGA